LNKEIKEIKEEIIDGVAGNIDYCKQLSQNLLRSHKWAIDRRKNDKLLDVYLQVLEDEKQAEYYLRKIKRSRSEDSLWDWLDEYNSFFKGLEHNLDVMTEYIDS
jgi:hypothetical protein